MVTAGDGVSEPDTVNNTVVPVLSILWLIGLSAMLVYSAFSLVRLHRKLLGTVRLRENVYLADHISTPFVIGITRPRIYLPSTLSEQEWDYIILHEQTHIRRLDHIVKLASFLALSVHWFNPLVWLAFVLSGRDMEMSCDEAVMKKMDGGIRADYSASLLSLATGRKIFAGAPLAFGEGDTTSRIKNVLGYKKPAAWVAAVSAVLVAALGVGLLTNGTASDTASDPETYRFPSYLYDRVTFDTGATEYPPSFEAVTATLTNDEMEGGLLCGKGFTLVRQTGEDWSVVPFKEGMGFATVAVVLAVGESETYTLRPDMLADGFGPGNYRIVTNVCYAAEDPPRTERTVWADFTISSSSAAPSEPAGAR